MKTILEALPDGTVTQICIVSEREDLAALDTPPKLADADLADPVKTTDKLKAAHAAKLVKRSADAEARKPKAKPAPQPPADPPGQGQGQGGGQPAK